MRVAIMQPYFLPYIGYFQLIQSVDKFIIYDNIEYTKKGWINRNRFLQNNKDALFTIPIMKGSDHLDVKERVIAADFNKEKLLNQLRGAYCKAPYFKQVFPVIEKIVLFSEDNLFSYIYNSVMEICKHLDIHSEVVISSTLLIDHSLQGGDKVIAICKYLEADVYINAIGGQALYSSEVFHSQGIILKFLQSRLLEYKQFNNDFIPWLSIVDVLMFNEKLKIKEFIDQMYELI